MRFFEKIKWLFCLFGLTAFFPVQTAKTPPCDPTAQAFRGYTFLYPSIINAKSAYAPYFMDFGGFYDNYFRADIQKNENLEEWNARFCSKATLEEVEEVVYKSSNTQLQVLLEAADDRTGKRSLPSALQGNTFAETLALNHCTEAVNYLFFAKKCEPHVSGKDAWDFKKRDLNAMQVLVNEGLKRFDRTSSHFFKMRLAYQIVRLAHYMRDSKQTIELYNKLVPQVDRKKPSIVFYWTLGHLAGALFQQKRYPEAAYRFSLIFRNCPSKRTQAFCSFYVKNDSIWQKTLKMCQSDGEKATLLALRAGKTHTYATDDLEAVYALEPQNPTLDLLLVSDVQQLEKALLRTPVTDKKYGKNQSAIRTENARKHLARLQTFVRKALKDKEIENPKLWALMDAYLILLSGKPDEAGYHLNRIEKTLRPDDEETNDLALKKQIEIWRTLIDILQTNPMDPLAETAVASIRDLDVFEEYPSFEPFLRDWLSMGYDSGGSPGKAFLASYDLRTLALNPTLPILDDILETAAKNSKSGIEMEMTRDTASGPFASRVLEIKGTYLFAIGQPEAALATFRQIPKSDWSHLKTFDPFKFNVRDCLNCPSPSAKPLNRMEIVETLGQLEFDAKAAAATGSPETAAENYFKIGLAYFNMSWFGYEWEAFDEFRDPDNWFRLARGPVFPLSGSPNGNLEILELERAVEFLDKSLALSRDPELSAKAAFMAAKCRQAQWFCSPECRYRPGTGRIPAMPEANTRYFDLMMRKYGGTAIYQLAIQECKWFSAYARRK